MTPTIIVQKPDELSHTDSRRSIASTLTNDMFFEEEAAKHREKQSPKSVNAKISTRNSLSEQAKANQAFNSAQFLENSLIEYFQMATLNNSFDLNKIVEVELHFSFILYKNLF